MGTVKKWPRKGLSGRWWGEAGRERIMRRENREREREGRRDGEREGTDRRSRGQGGEEVRPGPGCLELK